MITWKRERKVPKDWIYSTTHTRPQTDNGNTGFWRNSLNFQTLFYTPVQFDSWDMITLLASNNILVLFDLFLFWGTEKTKQKKTSLSSSGPPPHEDKGNSVRSLLEVMSHLRMPFLLSYLVILGSSLGLMKEKPAKAAWSIESMRFLSAWERRGFSFRNSRSKLLWSLGDFCWWEVRHLVRLK